MDGNPPISTADPAVNPAPVELVWNIDTLTGSPFTLNDGETLNITFDLYAGCTAVSGSQNVTIDYLISGTPSSDSTNFSIQVLPGGVTIKKNPNVLPQELGQNVTWTITVENTGIGDIKNVVVTDDLGTGLAYVSSTPAGNNGGQITTWDSTQIPALAQMAPGDIVTIDITSTVIACEFLDNVANVKWGCDVADTCFDTASDGGTATASVQRIVKTPLIDYTPPNITFNYCQDFVDTSFTVQNTGDGTAHDVWINVDFGAMTVSNLPAGAIYNNADKRFEIAIPIPAGGSFDLSFRLNYSIWCGGSFPAGDLLWQTEYKDDCDQPFYPPVQLSSISSPTGTTGVSIEKSGSPEAVQIGSQVTYTITSSYSGDIACGSGTAGVFTVVDTIPDGFTVIDAGGGLYVPGGGGTGGTITWTYTPPAALNTSIIIQLPDRSQCESYCFTLFTNSVTVGGTDCCGCALSESASQTTAIECEELVDSNKTVTPSIGIRCTNFEYTNTYDFTAAANLTLNSFTFEEHADNQQQYVPGSLAVTYDGADITGCVAVTDNTPGGYLVLDFSGCAADLVNNKNLTVVYQLTITENTASACGDTGFYSWSSLDMGVSGGECLQDGVIRETQYVTVDPPAMSVSVTGLGSIIHKCESQTITITLTQDSNIADPKDVRLVLSGLNYYVTDPAATVCGGSVAPVSCTPTLVGDDYVWEFADGFTGAGSSATLQMTVQKRCTGSGDLVATAYFDDNCNDDGSYDDTCSTTAVETPALLLGGDLLIEKNPEVYYASETMVAWKIYVTNRGSGNAYNVWIDDTLGAGLAFDSASVSPNTGVTVTANQDHNGGAINGATIAIDMMTPGERREITFNADQIDCDNLTNNVSASWGCVGIDCQTVVTDDSIVKLPDPLLINTNNVTTPIDVCSTVDGTITLKNAGQTTCYNLQVTETLAPGLTYVAASTRWRLNGGPWNGPNAAYDPSPATSPLQWTSTQIPGLATVTPGDIIEIDFDMNASCPFQDGNVSVSTSYENPCGKIFTNADSTFEVSLREPQISVTKTRVNEPIDCGDLVEWSITVQNTSGYTLPVIWVEDTLGAAFTYDSSVGDPPFTSDNGTYTAPNKITWELRNVNHNDTVTLTIRATADNPPCSPTVDNTVTAWWGCGAADGSSATKPGIDPPDDTLCLATSGTTDTNTPTRQPSLAFLGITVSPIQINSCDDSTELTVTITNNGPTDARNLDLEITLPPGITYNAGTSAVHIGPDDTGLPGAVADPAISGGTITYYDLADSGNNIANTLEADGGNDTLVLKFSVQSNCYLTSDIAFDLNYFDCCEDTQYSDTTSQTVTALFPDISVTKTPTSSQVDCNSDQTWTITVTNNGTGNAEVVRIEDTLGDWIDYVSSAPAATSLGGQVYGWEISNLAGGASTSFTITGRLAPDAPQSDCSLLLRQNNVRAIWGCGVAGDATDGDPTTTGYDCTHSSWSNATPALLVMPDLVIGDITPNITCSADGTFGGTITVAVQNQGDGNSNVPFTVQVTDGKGWTGTGTYNNNIAPGASVNVTIDIATWTPDCQPCAAPYSFDATVDLNNDICECNEGNNDFGPVTYTVPIPDLTITDIDFSNVSCSGDSISGTVDVIVRNNGCVAANNILVTLATDGCLAFSNETVVSLAAETSTTVSFTISGSWADCTTQNCQFTANVDPADAVCECDGGNNSRVETYSTTLPDLIVTDIDFANVSCNLDNVSGFVAVTIQNQGFGTASNFQVALATDGCLTFANQTVVGPLGAGASTTVNFPVTSSWANCADCDCQFTATVDPTGAVCECDGANNQATDTYSHTLPDLTVTSVTPAVNCIGDNNLQGTVTVNVANTGCGDANNAVVRLISTCGVVFVDQTVTLAAGSNTDLTFNFTPDCANCTCIFIAIIDPDNTICECSGNNNALASTPFTIDVPDLSVQSDTLAVSCAGDGSVTVSGNVTLQNTGCGLLFNGTVPLRFTLYDNTGCGGNVIDQWTYNATPATIFPGGGTQAFAVPPRIIASNLCTNSTGCQVSIRVEVDYTDSICECDGTNNTYCADNKAVDIPDIVITNDTLGLTCANDGQATISGAITVANNGCGSNLTSDFPVRLTLYDNTGCSGNISSQWSQTLTGVNIPAGGGTQTFTINPETIGLDMVANAANCQVSIRVEADFPDTVCECDDTNNTYCADTKAIDIPDLETSGENLAVTCESDGNIRASGTVTIANNGCGSNMTANIPVRFTLYDNSGCAGNLVAQWTETLGGANIPPGGGTQTFTITPEIITANICDNSTGCNVSLRIETDYTAVICESDGTDNNLCADKTVSIPELTVNSVTPSFNCVADGNLAGTVTVNVSNTGCGDANGAVVRLTSDCGLVFADQTVNLPAGGSANLTFNFIPVCSACTCTFTATIDPAGAICECDGSNNSLAAAPFTIDVPDLLVQSDTLQATCATDNQFMISGTVTVQNDGCGANATADIPVRFTLFDNTGCSGNQVAQWTEDLSSVSIASGGGTQTFTVTPHAVVANLCSDSTGCQFSIRVELDYTGSICECDGNNNTYCADNKNVDIPDIVVTNDTLAVNCQSDGQVTVSGSVTLGNNGCGSNLAGDVDVRFTLYDNTGCSGNVLSQWTQTFSGVNIAPGGGQAFTVTPMAMVLDMIANSTNCQVSILIEADSTGSICECDGTNNTRCADPIPVDIPDLEPAAEALTITFNDDGSIQVSGNVTIVNNGCGSNMVSDIPVRFTIYDNINCTGGVVSQWTETLTGSSIAPGGGTQVFTITPEIITTNICTNSTGCQVSILVEVDVSDTICESDGTDNSLCVDKAVDLPELTVNAVTPAFTCLNDGNLSGSVTVNVENTGCGAATDAVVRLVSDCGITFADQTITLPPSGNSDLIFTFTPLCSSCTCTFTATIDPTNAIPECDGTNNSNTAAPFTIDVPDLLVQAHTLQVDCSADNQFTVSGTVTVQNDGCGANATADIPVRFTLFDNTGCTGNQVAQWTDTLTSVNIASGGGTQSFTITPEIINADLRANSTNCQFSIQVELDYSGTICECDGGNNTYCASPMGFDIPDVVIQGDTLGVTCSSDGQVSISGTVTLANDGCGSTLTASVPMRFTMYDNTGCGGNVLSQWTETFGPVNIPALGATQTFTITPQTVVSNLVANSTNCRVSIFVEADVSGAICESDGTNNTWCADDKPIDIPDLETPSDALSVTCTSDGNVRVGGNVTIANMGCGSNVTAPIPVRFTMYDNSGCTGTVLSQWTETLGGANIAPGGGSQSFTITDHDITLDACANSANCAYSILVETDYTGSICESDGTDNNLCSDKTLAIPNLTITSVASSIVCLSDGSLTGTTVQVTNDGCAPATGVTVRLISDCGLTFSDETVDLAAGETKDVLFLFTAGITTCSCNFTATIDPDDTICECNGADNTLAGTTDMLIPDLEVQSEVLTVTCNEDGVFLVSGNVTLLNNGCGPDLTGIVPMRFTLYSGTGCGGDIITQWTENFPAAAIVSGGGTQIFTIQPYEFASDLCKESGDCQVSIFVEADYNDSICEWDGTDNSLCGDKIMEFPDLAVNSVTPEVTCATDGSLQGTVTVNVGNTGCADATGVRVRLTSDCGLVFDNKTITIPQGARRNVVFNFTPSCDSDTCTFTATIDPAKDICECSRTNNQRTLETLLPRTNLVAADITAACNPDNTVAVTVKVENNGNQNVSAVSIKVYDTDSNQVFNETRSIDAGAGETISFDAGPYPAGGQLDFRLVVDEENSVCECDGADNESLVSIYCPMAGTPGFDIERTCGPAQEPGGIYVFTIKVTNNGDADVTDCVVEDQLPDMLQYVHNSTTIDGRIIAEPEGGDNLKRWNIGTMTAGQTVIIQYQAIPSSDSDPGRYCNRAQARGTALNGDPVQSGDSDCCVVLTRTNEGCCLRIIEDPRGFFQQPQLPLSFVDPLFNTEQGMMTAFAALDLYKNSQLPQGSHGESLKQRLKNYALSTIEEFYLTSRQGVVSEDDTLWLSYGAAYPAGSESGWTGKRVDRTMTVAQTASELLALNRAIAFEEDPAKKKTFATIINKKIAFLEKHTDNLPHAWKLPLPNEESSDDAIEVSETEASFKDKVTLYLAATDLKAETAGKILPAMEKQLEEFGNVDIEQDLLKEHLLYTLGLANAGRVEQAKERMAAIASLYKTGDIKFDSLYLNALAVAADYKTGGSMYNDLFKELVATYRVKESGVFAEIQPDLTYKIDLKSLGALIMAFQSQLPRESDLFTTTMYRMVEESGLFITRKNLVVERTPLTLLKHYPFAEELLPMLSFTKGDRNLAPVFVEEAFVHSPSHLPATKNVIPEQASKVLIPEQTIDITEAGLLSAVMQKFGNKLQSQGKRIVREKGRSLEHTGRGYFEYLLESDSGITSGSALAIPYQSVAIRGQKEQAVHIEPIETRKPFAAETLANYLLAGTVYMEGPGAQKETWLRAEKLQKQLLETFASTGYVPATFKLFVNKTDQSIRIEASEEKASGITLAKLLAATGGDDSFLLEQLKLTDTPLQPEDMLPITHIPGMANHFNAQLEALVDNPQPGINGIAAAVLAGDILGRDTARLREKLDKLWNRRMELPASVETETIESGLLHHYNSPQFLLYLSANAARQSEFQFQRTLNMFTYLVEMGREGTPASGFWLVEDSPRQHAEPGDVMSLKVRVTNDCDPNFMRPLTIPSLFIKAEFTPDLVYNGTEYDEELDVLGKFRWKYSNFDRSGYLTYIYQALIPKEYRDNYIEGVIVAAGSAGVLDMDPDKISGDRCIDKWEIERVPVLPLQQVEIQVFGDLNANGKKDPGETGIAGIQFRDTRGNIYRSNSEGQFVISAGDDTIGLQIQIQTIPSNYTLSTPVTRRINRHTPAPVIYGLVPCIEVSGIVYIDGNQNGSLDQTEKRIEGIVVEAKLKEAVTSAENPGQFTFKSLPESWLKEIRVSTDQPFNTTVPPANLSIQIIKKQKKQ